MKLDSNYLLRKKRHSVVDYGAFGADIQKLIISPSSFASILQVTKLAGGDISQLKEIGKQWVDTVKAWSGNVKEFYLHSLRGDWSDIRTAWEKALKPVFFPESMSPEGVVSVACSTAMQVSEMCQKADYTMKGAKVKAWFYPWLFYFDKHTTRDTCLYEGWAAMQNWGDGSELAQFGKNRGLWDYSDADSEIKNGGSGWFVAYYAVYDLDFSQRDKIFSIIQRQNYAKLFQVREAAKQQTAVNEAANNPLNVPTDWGLEYMGKDFETVKIDENHIYFYGNKNSMQAGVEGKIVLHSSGTDTLQIGSQFMFDMFNFGNDPQFGVVKGFYRKKSDFMPPVGYTHLAIARGGQGFTPEKGYKYAFGTDSTWVIVSSEQLSAYIGKHLEMDNLPKDVHNLFEPSGDIKPMYYKYLYAKKYIASKYETAKLGNFGNAARVKNWLKNR